jgi:hypothetical protein
MLINIPIKFYDSRSKQFWVTCDTKENGRMDGRTRVNLNARNLSGGTQKCKNETICYFIRNLFIRCTRVDKFLRIINGYYFDYFCLILNNSLVTVAQTSFKYLYFTAFYFVTYIRYIIYYDLRNTKWRP